MADDSNSSDSVDMFLPRRREFVNISDHSDDELPVQPNCKHCYDLINLYTF